jgi:predicted metal-binding membrane protein
MGAYQIPLESVFKRDRAVVISGLVGISVASWAYMAFGMTGT